MVLNIGFQSVSPIGVPSASSARVGELDVAVIGAGPAGLMAAEVLVEAGFCVHVFDRMPSAGRKFLLAGRGGLNLTHSESGASFLGRFGGSRSTLEPLLADFGSRHVRDWASSLGIPTFVGTSGRVFPVGMKAAPLLRAWLHRLRNPVSGVAAVFHHRHVWQGWDERGALVFESPQGAVSLRPRATVLALGGGSWARLGSDGAWVPHLERHGVAVAPLEASNCGFDVSGGWTEVFRTRFAGQPLKTISLTARPIAGVSEVGVTAETASADTVLANEAGVSVLGSVAFARRGECVVTASGLEGSLIYAASAALRTEIKRVGLARIDIDLLPDWSAERVRLAVCAPRGSRSLSSHLKSKLGLDGVKLGLLYEQLSKPDMQQPAVLAAAIKALPVTLASPRPIDEAISTAGGVCFDAFAPNGMLKAKPGVFCAGEMLDWDAPTGGYLLTASMATGRWAGVSAARYLLGEDSPSVNQALAE